MRSLGAAQALPDFAPTAFTVIGDDARARGDVIRLLADAGFRPHDDPEPYALIVLLAPAREDERLREVRGWAELHPDAWVLVVLSGEVPNAALRGVLLAGATGIVFDDDIDRALVATARATVAGQLTVPSVLARQIAPRPLSHREKQILALVVRGMTNREIAHKLFLAESTVKSHLSSAFRKIDARSRSEAVARIQDPDNGYGMGVLSLSDMSTAVSPLTGGRP